MSFTRTNAGLSNLAIFHGVDIVIFTEGGDKSYSFEEVVNGKYNKISVDIKFWSNLLQKYKFSKKYQFRALGSKTSSKKLRGLIVENKVQNIAVACDSDLDEALNKKQPSPHILYTQGYSWENDVYTPDLVKKQIEALTLCADFPEEYIEIINEAYDDFSRNAKRLLKLEIIFRKNGKRLITDCNGERFINGKSVPKLKIQQVRKLVNERRSSLQRPIKLDDINLCPIQYSYGKLREALGIAIISYICGKKQGIKSLPKDLITASMIERYISQINHKEDSYYKTIIEQLEAA